MTRFILSNYSQRGGVKSARTRLQSCSLCAAVYGLPLRSNIPVGETLQHNTTNRIP